MQNYFKFFDFTNNTNHMTFYSTFKHSLRLFLLSEAQWKIINNYTDNIKHLFTRFMIPLIAIMSICNFLGYQLFDSNASTHLKMHLFTAIFTFCFSCLSIFLSAYLVKHFAQFQASKKRFNQAMILSCYSSIPGIVFNSIAFLLPMVPFLSILSLFSFLILYYGIGPILNIPSERKTGYFTFILIGLLSLYAILGALFLGLTSLFGF